MLSFFRRGATEKIMLVVLVVGLFAIVITGFGTQGMGGIGELAGGGSDVLARVGGEKITAGDASQQVERQLTRLRQQQPDITTAQLFQQGIYEEIVDQLVSQRALAAFGREQGLAVSRKMIDTEIAGIPAFKNFAGQFDQATFQNALAQARLTEAGLRREIGDSLLQQQLFGAVAGNAKVPNEMARQYASLLLEQRAGTIGLVPVAAMPKGADPTDAELAAYFSKNSARYAVPEQRVIRYAAFDRESLGQSASATPAEIEAFYKANPARFGAIETRSLSQVVLPDRKAADAFAAKLAQGISFDAAAQQAGFGGADLSIGAQTKAALTNASSAAVAEAAFAAAQGATTAPTQSPLGWHVIRVDAINRTEARTLASVTEEIRKELDERKGQQALADKVARIEDKIADGASLQEVARDEKLTLTTTPPLTASGSQPDNPAALPNPDLTPALLRGAFEMQPEDDPEVTPVVQGQKAVVFEVTRIVPAAPPPLARIAAQVKADLIRQRELDRARQIAQSLVAKINGGTAPQQAFAQAGVTLPALQPVVLRRIDISRNGQQVPPELALLFSLPVGRAQMIPAPQGAGWMVVTNQQAQRGDASGTPALIDATRSQFRQVMSEEYAAQFVHAVEQQLKIKRNDAAIAKTKTQLAGGTAP